VKSFRIQSIANNPKFSQKDPQTNHSIKIIDEHTTSSIIRFLIQYDVIKKKLPVECQKKMLRNIRNNKVVIYPIIIIDQ